MQIKVIGVQRRQGKSKKTGKDYDFISVFFTGAQQGVRGEVGQDLILDPQFYREDDIIIGSKYNVDFDRFGHVLSFNLCK